MSYTSRAPTPAPLCTLGSGHNTTASPTSPTSQGTPRIATTTDGWPTWGVMDRKDSSNSVSSTMSSASAVSIPKGKKLLSPSSGNVNQYTHCGRHTDQYLFSGWSKVFNRKR